MIFSKGVTFLRHNCFILSLGVILISITMSRLSSGHEDICVHGNGKIIRTIRHVDHFNAISVKGAFDVHVKFGGDIQVVIVAETNLVPFIKTEVRDEVLYIDTSRSLCTNQDFRIEITCPDIRQLTAEGSNDIHVTDIAVSYFSIVLRGSSGAILEGSARDSSIKITGVGDLDASKFKVKNLQVNLSGSGDAIVWVEERLDAVVSGAGTILYIGNPSITKKIIGDMGSIERF